MSAFGSPLEQVRSGPRRRSFRLSDTSPPYTSSGAARRPASTTDQSRSGRGFIRDLFTRWHIDSEVREDAELLITELVTNAVIHAHSDVTVEVHRDGDIIRFSVFDGGPGEVRLRHPAPEDLTGRGLVFLDQIAPGWEVASDPDGGKTVYFSLSASPSRRGVAL